MQVIKIDDQGFFVGVEHISQEKQVDFEYVTILLPKNEQGCQLPFYKAKWDGEKWIESKLQEEIEAEHLLVSLQPTQEELADAELEIKMLTLLFEMEVI